MRTAAAFPGAGLGKEPPQKGLTLPAEILTPKRCSPSLISAETRPPIPTCRTSLRSKFSSSLLPEAGMRLDLIGRFVPRDGRSILPIPGRIDITSLEPELQRLSDHNRSGTMVGVATSTIDTSSGGSDTLI